MPSQEEFQNDFDQHVPIRPRRGNRGEIRCAQSGEVFHPSTDIYTNGHYSHKLGMWFSNSYYYNEYCFVNSIHAYENTSFRNQMAKYFTRVTEANERREKQNTKRRQVPTEGIDALEIVPDYVEAINID